MTLAHSSAEGGASIPAGATARLGPISKLGGGVKRIPGRYLIWSNYHGAWHQRAKDGHARGYTDDLARAGLFDWEIAAHYNEGKRGRDRLISPTEARDHIARRIAELADLQDNLADLSRSLMARTASAVGTTEGREPKSPTTREGADR